MAAPIVKHAKGGKLAIANGEFDKDEKEFTQTILNHYFNYSVDIVVPKTKCLPPDIDELCRKQKAYVVHDLPAAAILDPDLIGAFISAGKFYGLSHGTRINYENCLAVLPTGHLILHVTSDTYIQLGLEGKPSWYNRLGQNKYVIDVDLKAAHFVPGRKGYERVLSALSRSGLKFNLLIAWDPSDGDICSSSLRKYFNMKGYQCSEVPIDHSRHRYEKVDIPVLSEIDESCIGSELFEWLGMVANNVYLSEKPDEFVSTYSYNGETEQASCLHYTISGFFTPPFISNLVNKLRCTVMKDQGNHWCSVTVYGFQDTPISWRSYEHGFTVCGDNLYTVVLLPSERYCLYRALGCHSEAP
ncbi:hypothetical protein FSP39_020741 [Pinctada imbricata]|uniref:Uncharacterized protein n=1 Tax=Pinctada imbricata TaxID=66713 RepID=A0AA88XJN3_PINIB|nr:hypothetical protein FSP39_020741 [Pinctada imbricata]